MLSDEELLKDVAKWWIDHPASRTIFGVMVNFKISENKAKEVLNRILTSVDLL